jgi:hypothetical protein
MTKTTTVMKNEANGNGTNNMSEKSMENSNKSDAKINSNGNKLNVESINLSFENSTNVDMNFLSTVHICAAQVRR